MVSPFSATMVFPSILNSTDIFCNTLIFLTFGNAADGFFGTCVDTAGAFCAFGGIDNEIVGNSLNGTVFDAEFAFDTL